MTGRGGLGALFWQWLPTSVGSSMLVLEIPIVAAAAARSGSGTSALAALGIGIAVIVVVNGPALALAPLVVSLDGRVELSRLRRYALTVGAASALVIAALAVFRQVPELLLDLDPGTSGEVSAVLFALAPASIVVAVRRYQHGRLIALGVTAGIGVATGVRLAASAAFAWSIAPFTQAGALPAALALTLGACAESITLGVLLRRHRVAATPPAAGGPPRSIAVVHLPMAATRMLNMAPQMITTVGVAHAAQSLSSLAAWPVVFGLLSLFTGPMADYETVATAALRRSPGDTVPRRLGLLISALVTALYGAVLITPLLHLYLGDFSGLTGEPLRLGLAWAVLTLLVPAGWVLRGYLRAVAMSTDRHRRLAVGVAGHLAGLAVTLAVTTVAGLPGVACAALAVLGGVVAEMVALAVPELRPTAREVQRVT